MCGFALPCWDYKRVVDVWGLKECGWRQSAARAWLFLSGKCYDRIIFKSILHAVINHRFVLTKFIYQLIQIILLKIPKALDLSQELSEILKNSSLFFSSRLFGVSEPKLTEKPPPMNPKNHKPLRLFLLYAKTPIKSIASKFEFPHFFATSHLPPQMPHCDILP